MADDVPSPEQMVPSLLHAVMWACMFGCVDAVIAGKPWFIWAGAFSLSLISHIVGIKWPQIKPNIGPHFASFVEGIASKVWYRRLIYAATVIAILASIGIRVYRHSRLTGNPLHPVVTSVPISSVPESHSVPSSDEKPVPPLFPLPPKQRAKLDKLKDQLFKIKAQLLDMPEYYKVRRAKDNFRNTLEEIENQHGCLIDMTKVECLPKPPATIAKNDVDIDIRAKMVADELSKTSFWVIRGNTTKVRVPIVVLVSLTNRQPTPVKIDLLYLDARSVNGWADIRMADSLFPGPQTMSEQPLVLEAKNANGSMKGEYLLPTLYDRIIQPGDAVEGWIIAEYPKGFKYGNSIGDIRISLRAGDRWIASKTFPANPRKALKDLPGKLYFVPLDTLITEDW